jgi:hypothetical protein
MTFFFPATAVLAVVVSQRERQRVDAGDLRPA